MIRILAIALALCALGCETRAPVAPQVSSSIPNTLPDGTLNLRRYEVLYTSCGTFVLSYPQDFIGPIPDGYGRVGSTARDMCATTAPDQPPIVMEAKAFGDPTSDDGRKIGDPDVGNENADGDGVIVR